MDTSPAAHAIQLQLYRQAGPEGRVQIAAELSEIIRDLSRAGVRMRNPDFTEAEVTREVLRIFYGDRAWKIDFIIRKDRLPATSWQIRRVRMAGPGWSPC